MNITGGKVNGTIYGGSSNSGAVTNNKVTVTGGAINDIIWGGDSNGGDAKYNAVTISGDAKIVVEGIMGEGVGILKLQVILLLSVEAALSLRAKILLLILYQ